MSTFESLVFYRGMSNEYPTDRASLVVPRRDRRPRNSPLAFHEAADRWFESRFGVRYRSQGVFVTAHPEATLAYAASASHVMRVIPLSSYKYCWSPAVLDLIFAATKYADGAPESVNAYLDSVNYQQSELDKAHASGHEVMLSCECYVAIPVGLLGVTITDGPSIIVPDRRSEKVGNGRWRPCPIDYAGLRS